MNEVGPYQVDFSVIINILGQERASIEGCGVKCQDRRLTGPAEPELDVLVEAGSAKLGLVGKVVTVEVGKREPVIAWNPKFGQRRSMRAGKRCNPHQRCQDKQRNNNPTDEPGDPHQALLYQFIPDACNIQCVETLARCRLGRLACEHVWPFGDGYPAQDAIVWHTGKDWTLRRPVWQRSFD